MVSAHVKRTLLARDATVVNLTIMDFQNKDVNDANVINLDLWIWNVMIKVSVIADQPRQVRDATVARKTNLTSQLGVSIAHLATILSRIR